MMMMIDGRRPRQLAATAAVKAEQTAAARRAQLRGQRGRLDHHAAKPQHRHAHLLHRCRRRRRRIRTIGVQLVQSVGADNGLCGRYDSTSIRRPFDRRSITVELKVIKVTVTYNTPVPAVTL